MRVQRCRLRIGGDGYFRLSGDAEQLYRISARGRNRRIGQHWVSRRRQEHPGALLLRALHRQAVRRPVAVLVLQIAKG